MSLACLKNWVGVQGCTDTTPDSGLFINQLPGVELKMIDQIADEQQVDFNGVWDDVQERAVRRFRTDINAEFKKRFKIKNITESIDMERLIDTSSTTAAAGEYRGVALTLRRQDEDFANSNMQAIRVQDVSLYFTSTNITTIKVFDLETGTELFTKAVAAPAAIGWQTITILQEFTSREIFIGYDATLLNGVSQDIQKLENAVNRSQDGCNYYCISCDGGNMNAELRGALATIADTIQEAALTTGDDAFGLSVKWSVICSYDSFVCNNKEEFTRAFWYLLGIELMLERMNTSRLNEFTVFNQKKAEELWVLFETIYRGGTIIKDSGEITYESELNMVIDGINLDMADYCIECNANVRTEESRL